MAAFQPVNALNAIGSGIRDAAVKETTAVRNDALREKSRQEKIVFDDAQRLANTQWLAAAAQYGTENPAAVPAIIKTAKDKGLIDQAFDAAEVTPEELLEIHQRAMGALGNVRLQDESMGGLPGQRNPITNQWTPTSSAISRAKPPVSEREYQIYSDQEIAAGRQPMEFLPFLQERARVSGYGGAYGRATGTGEVVPSGARVSAFQKYPRMQSARRNLDGVREANKAINENIIGKGGPGQAGPLSLTKEGQSFNRYVSSLMADVQALTRIPGIGAQSDWEGRLQKEPLPSLKQYPEVREQALSNLEALVTDLEAAVIAVTSGNTAGMVPQQPEAPEESDIEGLLQQARDAIAQGASPDAVQERLRNMGIDPGSL